MISVLCAFGAPDADSLIRGIYINHFQASKADYLSRIYARADSGYINAIVVDLKSDFGYLCYDSHVPLAVKLGAVKRYVNLAALVDSCRAHGIRIIARIVCYRDDYLAGYKNYGMRNAEGAVWQDKTGTAWVNPYVKGVNEYLVSIVKELDDRGVTAVALDYVRFPTDGNVGAIRLTNVKGPRHKPITTLLAMLREQTDVEIGICIFGYAVWYELKREGQEVGRISEYADAIYPMLYPSHFDPTFLNEENEYWRNYWIYYDSVQLARSKSRAATKIIPFVQGFDLYARDYGTDYISSQITGALCANADGFLIWNAASSYATSWIPLRQARSLSLIRSAQSFPDTRRIDTPPRY